MKFTSPTVENTFYPFRPEEVKDSERYVRCNPQSSSIVMSKDARVKKGCVYRVVASHLVTTDQGGASYAYSLEGFQNGLKVGRLHPATWFTRWCPGVGDLIHLVNNPVFFLITKIEETEKKGHYAWFLATHNAGRWAHSCVVFDPDVTPATDVDVGGNVRSAIQSTKDVRLISADDKFFTIPTYGADLKDKMTAADVNMNRDVMAAKAGFENSLRLAKIHADTFLTITGENLPGSEGLENLIDTYKI